MKSGNERILVHRGCARTSTTDMVSLFFPHLIIVVLPVGDVGDRKQFVGTSGEVVVISEGSNGQTTGNSEQ